MITEISLTERQRELLQTASTQFSGLIDPAAEGIRLFGGARETMCQKLKDLGLIGLSVDGQMVLSADAYRLLTPQPAEVEGLPIAAGQDAHETEDATEGVQPSPEPNPEDAPAPKPRKVRENTKQAKIIEMLKRPEGATLQQIMDETGWQKHTARAALSRTIQKDLGIPLVSEKSTGKERVYMIKTTDEANE